MPAGYRSSFDSDLVVTCEIATIKGRMRPETIMRTWIAFACLAMIYPAKAQQQETLLCLGEQSTGFKFEGQDWKAVHFNVKNDKFVVRPTKELDGPFGKFNYIVTRIGSNDTKHYCTRGENSSQMACGGLGYGFVVNFKTLRFQDYYGICYVGGENSNDNTPSMTIGTCSRIN